MKNYSASRPSNRKIRFTKKWQLVTFLLVVAAGIIIILEITDQTYIFHEPYKTPEVITSTEEPASSEPEEKNNISSLGTTPSPESPKQGDATTSTPASGAAPSTPYGDFVSNHHPNLDGNPAPSSMQSVCNTSPGAKCSIEFTNQDGIIKGLAAQTTDNNGSTIWNWDIKQSGFTVGSWKIKVIATLNGKTTIAYDALNLDVEP